MKISIIIVSYNSEKYIFDCIDSIYKYNDIGNDLEVIVVDNNSLNTSDVLAKIKNNYANKVKYVQNSENLGYGAANNVGAMHSKGEYLIFMNPDIKIISPILNKILNKFQDEQELGMLGVTFTDGSNSLYYKPEKTTFLRIMFERYLLKYLPYNIEEVYPSGSFIIFAENSFSQIGGFDENIFMYYEEPDMSNRILSIGKKVGLEKSISVFHHAHGRNVNKQLLKIASESRSYYFDKYEADISRYYTNLMMSYKIKLFFAYLLRNKHKQEEFRTWISICENKGKVELY